MRPRAAQWEQGTSTPSEVHVVAAFAAGVAEGRRRAAEEIRAHADRIAARSEALARVPAGTADDHPVMLGLEFAARVAEGACDLPPPLPLP